MSDPKTLTVHLLGKDYQVSCPPGQERGLERAAQRLDQQMQAIRNGGKIIGLERIAVMAALNLTYELIARSVRYIATPESGAWDRFLAAGSDPSAEGWEAVTLSAQFFAEGDFDQADLEALGQIVGRQKTTNEVTALSRFDRGLATQTQMEEAIAADDDVRLGDFASLRRRDGGADPRDDGEDVRDAAEPPPRSRGSRRRVRA